MFCKNTKILNYLLLATLFILFAFEHSDEDYLNYLSSYESIDTGRGYVLLSYEPSYWLFCIIGNQFNLSFDAARSFVCVIEIIAIGTTIRLFTNNIALVLSLFFLFPAMFDAELFRWLAGMSLIIFAFPYVIRGENKYDYLIYLLLVFLATTLHTSCIFFIVYLLLVVKSKNSLFIIVASVFAVILVTSQTALLYKILELLPINDFLNEKFQKTEQSNLLGLLALALKQSFIFIVGYIAYKKNRKNRFIAEPVLVEKDRFSLKRDKYDKSTMGYILCSKLWSINLISMLLIVLSIYTPQVQRLFHVLFMFNLISIAFLYEHDKKWWTGVVCSFVCSVLLLLIMLNFVSEGTMPVFISHFKEGFLINFMRFLETL